MTRRRLRLAGATAAASVLAIGLAGCGGSSGIQSKNGVATVTLASSITGSSFLAVTAGIDQGFFADHQVKVEVVKVKSTAEGTAALASGDADIAAMLTQGVIAADASGAKLKMIANLLTQDQSILYAKPGITSVADLKGKKFGIVGPGSASEMLARALVTKAGLDPGSVTYVPSGAGATLMTALVSGQIDAAGLTPPNDSIAKSQGMVKIADYRDVFPDLTPQVFAVQGGLITDHSPELKRFLAAYGEAATWVQGHPAEAVTLLAKDTQSSRADAQAAYDFAKPDYSTDGAIDPKGVEAWLALSKEYGTTTKNLPSVDELYDPSLLPSAS